ncbi:MAG: RNA polymerase sigma factor [Candidatus Pacebacteria bacterium]|nr:RNA polymerase sigma factor [Candidatus Paceibacterota bacterium]MDD3283558.1 RNA polymerase sigma factor [Candidatus Paceibacterota bacterium]MDD3969584.1 RNA polymerase sigma factor [Candidatus Paceibacterota bacterium]MDD4737870.1 RNA polymerase sigma factor [Candidatus Paceibacterota bacterium]
MDKLDDEKIIQGILDGNNELYREIIKRYEKKLSHYLRKFSNDRDDVEDILQVVFIKAYKNLYGFNTSKKFSSWIYRIAHNEGINHLKKNKKNKICLDDVEYKLIDNKADINKETDGVLLKRDVECALGELKKKYKEPLVLFYLEEMSYEEISDILRIPKNTVGTLILRGKKILREKLLEVKKEYE